MFENPDYLLPDPSEGDPQQESRIGQTMAGIAARGLARPMQSPSSASHINPAHPSQLSPMSPGGFEGMDTNHINSILGEYGLSLPAPKQNVFLPEPGTDNFFGRHPTVSRALEGAVMGAAFTGPSRTTGEGISNIAQGLLQSQAYRGQVRAAQMQAPMVMAQHLATLAGQQANEHRMQAAEGRAAELLPLQKAHIQAQTAELLAQAATPKNNPNVVLGNKLVDGITQRINSGELDPKDIDKELAPHLAMNSGLDNVLTKGVIQSLKDLPVGGHLKFQGGQTGLITSVQKGGKTYVMGDSSAPEDVQKVFKAGKAVHDQVVNEGVQKQQHLFAQQDELQSRREIKSDDRQKNILDRQQNLIHQQNYTHLLPTVKQVTDSDATLAMMLDQKRQAEAAEKRGDPAVGAFDSALLMNHIGLTLGRIRGARPNNDQIKEAGSARSLPQDLQIMYDKVFGGGQRLTPAQRNNFISQGTNSREAGWQALAQQANFLKIPQEMLPQTRKDLPKMNFGGMMDNFTPAFGAPNPMTPQVKTRNFDQ